MSNDTDDLLHQVGNLLGTIHVQAEAARAEGSSEAFQRALRYIVDSAEKVERKLREAKARRARGGGEAD